MGKSQTMSIPWQGDIGGLFESDRILTRNPLKPGESRKFKALVPLMNIVATHTLNAKEYEMVDLLTDSRKLLRIDVSVEMVGFAIDSIVWSDQSGEVLKTSVPAVGQISYRCAKEQALAPDTPERFDLVKLTTVQVGPIDRIHDAKQIVYRVTTANGDPSKSFAHGPSQQVTAESPDSALIVVRAITPDDPAEVEAPDRPVPVAADSTPNNLIQSDGPRIVKMATSVSPDETDTWTVARELEKYVRSKIQRKNFSRALATASEVAANLEGDCTEHSVLLAALCRARKIPARVAIGLVYSRALNGFGYHMWNEVWIDDRWVPLDATLGRGGIGPGHLKLHDSSLAGASSYTAFLPVLKVLGGLKIKVDRIDRVAQP